MDRAQVIDLGTAKGLAGNRRKIVEDLFREHNTALIGFLRVRLSSEQEARDVAQEAYVKILQLDKPQEVSFLKSYLYKTAANLAVDHRRRQWTREKGAKEIALFDFDTAPNQERALASRQELEIVRKAVAELPPKCRQAFLLSREGWPNIRIAAHMNVTDRTIRNYLCVTLDHIEFRLEALSGSRGVRKDG